MADPVTGWIAAAGQIAAVSADAVWADRDQRSGGRFAMDADLTVYWPDVRPCWEEQ